MKQNGRYRRIRQFRSGTNFSGQHLLHSKKLARSLVKLAHLQSNECVIDIGAGTGALTLPLAAVAGRVLAVENDPTLVKTLDEKTKDNPHVTILQGDFLRIPLPRTPFCVVAGIPYSITTAIMGRLLNNPTLPLQRAVIVMEKGAAKRFTATPITDPRIATWRMWFDFRRERTIPPHQFSPPPKVDSAVLLLKRKPNPPVPVRYHRPLKTLLTQGLRVPQAPISDALRGIFTPPQLKHLVRNLGVDRETAIATLDEKQWGIVFQTLFQYGDPVRWPRLIKKR
jgi:23S rRNA (adenine-N6)-dimethyltransferase